LAIIIIIIIIVMNELADWLVVLMPAERNRSCDLSCTFRLSMSRSYYSRNTSQITTVAKDDCGYIRQILQQRWKVMLFSRMRLNDVRPMG